MDYSRINQCNEFVMDDFFNKYGGFISIEID